MKQPLPDETMKDVRLVHDRVGSYADWMIVNGILPYGPFKEMYLLGKVEPNYPLPAIPEIHQWDYSLWSMLVNIPPMTDEEWEREEDAWQDYLDTLD